MVKNDEYSGNMRSSCSTLRVETEETGETEEAEETEDLTIQQFADFSLIFFIFCCVTEPRCNDERRVHPWRGKNRFFLFFFSFKLSVFLFFVFSFNAKIC